MAIRVRCPSCETVYSLADHLAGKTVRCKKCESAIVVRAAKGRAEKEGDERESRPDSSEREKIQTRASAPKRPLGRTEEEPSRPRRRDGDEDELDIRRPQRGSNRGLVIGLIAGCAGLLLLLAGGLVVLIVVLVNRSEASRQAESVAMANAGANNAPAQPPPGMGDPNKEAGFLVNTDPTWPEVVPPHAPPDSVVLRIAGVADENTQEAISEKLQALGMKAGQFAMHSRRKGDRMTVVIMNVPDVQAYSQKLDFGKVESVKDRFITMTAHKVKGPPTNADALTKLLYQLNSPNVLKRHEALRKLKSMLPDDKHRAEVVKALEPLLGNDDHFTREWAIESLGIWGNKDAVPLLLNAMREQETRGVAMKALARLKDERAVEPIAERLDELFDRHNAAEALKAMGPMAEKAVLARLNHHDWMVRQTACEILGAIGTKQSIAPLEKVVAAGKDPFSGPNHIVAKFAEQAIQAIKTRQ
jgi:predicted Zn finger-like uncharacterized protein